MKRIFRAVILGAATFTAMWAALGDPAVAFGLGAAMFSVALITAGREC